MPWLFYSVQPVTAGSATWELPLGDSPSLVGKTFGAQVSSFYSTTVNCELLPNAAWSNLIELTFGL